MENRHKNGAWSPDIMVRRGALWVHNYAAHYGGEYDYYDRGDLLLAAKHLRQDVHAYINEAREDRPRHVGTWIVQD